MVRRAEEVSRRVQDDVLATSPPASATRCWRALKTLVAGRLAEPVHCQTPVRRRAAA